MSKKKKNKRSSHPIMFFIYASLFTIIVSGIAGALNFQATYDKLTTIAGEVESITIPVNSLFSIDGIKFLLTTGYESLKSFAPFGVLLIASIAFGIALKSGYLKTFCNAITKRIPKPLIVFLYSLICIIASVDSNMGYVLLLPLGAVLFMSMNRNPIGGLALGFASLASGHGAGLFITSLDYNLVSYTEASAKLLDTEYIVSQSSNLFFTIAAAVLIAVICTYITEKIMVRKLGKNSLEEEEIMLETDQEKKGLVAVLIATIIFIIPVIIMLIPSQSNGFVGLLLDKSQGAYSKMLFSNDALFITGLVGITSLLFAIQGFVFGVVTGTIKKIRDMVNFSTDYLRSVGGIFVLVFFAALLIAIVNETNIGTVITGTFANLISVSDFSFIPLILLILAFTLIANIVLPGSIAKWAVLAPNVMPLVMKANINPEFAQLVFRAGDSITNCITPLFTYFVIFIGFIEVYTKNKNDFSIRGCYKVIFPYFVGIMLMWIFAIICWYIIGLPIGPGIYPGV
ncbi:MAG: AbgT family transporter [Bacilli bacterium]